MHVDFKDKELSADVIAFAITAAEVSYNRAIKTTDEGGLGFTEEEAKEWSEVTEKSFLNAPVLNFTSLRQRH